MRVLHLDSDELYLYGFSRAFSADWDVTSVLCTSAEKVCEISGSWDVRVVGLGGALAEDRAEPSRISRLGEPVLAMLSEAITLPAVELVGCDVGGYVLRSASAQVVRTAVLEVAAGRTFVDAQLVPLLAPSPSHVWDCFGLTPQQAEVATRYVHHGTRRLVASDMCISENTVKYHLASIYRKTAATSVHELRQLLTSKQFEEGVGCSSGLLGRGLPTDYPQTTHAGSGAPGKGLLASVSAHVCGQCRRSLAATERQWLGGHAYLRNSERDGVLVNEMNEFEVLNGDVDTEQVGIGTWICWVGCVGACVVYYPAAVAGMASVMFAR